MRTGFFSLLLILALAACAVRETVIAEVGSQEIEVKSLQTYLEAVTGASWQELDEPVASRLMDQFLDQEVVTAAARKLHDVEVPEEPGERPSMVRRLLREVCGAPPPVPPEEIAGELAGRRTETRPARLQVRQIVLDDLDRARLVHERLLAGEDFVDISIEVSLAPNASAGGGLGFIEQGVLTPELDELIFSLAAGEISEPVEGPAGYHLFQVLEIVPAGAAPDAVLEQEVARELNERAVRRFTRECVDRHAEKIGVRLYSENLWFGYQGRYSEDNDVTK